MKHLLFLLSALFITPLARADDLVVLGTAQVEHQVTIRDSTTGALKTGLTNGSAGLAITVRADKQAETTYSGANIEAIASISAYVAPSASKIKFGEVDATNAPGVYMLRPLDSIYTNSTARTLTFTVIGTGITADPLRVNLTADPAAAIWNALQSAYKSAGSFGEGVCKSIVRAP